MPRYYFDMREEYESVADDEGIELGTLETVHEEAARSLADMARDAIRRRNGAGHHHQMAIDVRDDSGPVLQVTLTFTFTIDRRRRH